MQLQQTWISGKSFHRSADRISIEAQGSENKSEAGREQEGQRGGSVHESTHAGAYDAECDGVEGSGHEGPDHEEARTGDITPLRRLV